MHCCLKNNETHHRIINLLINLYNALYLDNKSVFSLVTLNIQDASYVDQRPLLF